MLIAVREPQGSSFFLRTLVASAISASTSLGTLGCGENAADQSGEGGAPVVRDSGSNTSLDRDAGSESSNRNAAAAKDAQAEQDSGSTGSNPGSNMDGGVVKTRFSFFLTSQAGLARLAGKADGFGGDLRFGKADGLSGADEICRQLAEASLPGNGRTWRAFLSVTKGPDGMPVNAIDRIGSGPWYDRRDHLFAMDKAALMNARPAGCDPTIVNDFPNKDGVPNHDPGTGIIDNHNTLTGSSATGGMDTRGLAATCQDWTNAQPDGGKPRCGVSWPRGQLNHWISTLDEGGCAPGSTPPGAEGGARGTVGALGGYGGFYCFGL